MKKFVFWVVCVMDVLLTPLKLVASISCKLLASWMMLFVNASLPCCDESGVNKYLDYVHNIGNKFKDMFDSVVIESKENEGS